MQVREAWNISDLKLGYSQEYPVGKGFQGRMLGKNQRCKIRQEAEGPAQQLADVQPCASNMQMFSQTWVSCSPKMVPFSYALPSVVGLKNQETTNLHKNTLAHTLVGMANTHNSPWTHRKSP